jgi:hypothetical protein
VLGAPADRLNGHAQVGLEADRSVICQR